MVGFRRRTRGTVNQIGKAFPIFEKKKLPRLVIPKTLRIVRDIPLDKLEGREKHPIDFESRVNWFIQQYKSGHPWAPIWAFRRGGKYIVYDGNARLGAARALGLKALQANIMSSAQQRRLFQELRIAPKI